MASVRTGREIGGFASYSDIRIPLLSDLQRGLSVRILLTLVLLGCMSSASPPGQKLHADEDANAVKQTLATFLDLQLKYDADAVGKMLDDAFLYVSPDGSVM